ncbi:hypothetical protein PZB74_16550 [Porifericola rhodea]|uniref:type ISP restriction/modification enzyme n=1 Tax=Porifericola rhodea TaxID=930972 RepID=UPI002666CBC6|nr:type ISP restriction/modification enzyme [Porifericola rhodea]WKN30575.1 hypothetical protein PZB74_16550 [Porifericola rhodea]
MLLDQKSQTFLNYLPLVCDADQPALSFVEQHLSIWQEAYQKSFKQLNRELKEVCSQNKKLRIVLNDLKQNLVIRLSDRLRENDLLKITATVLFLQTILSEKQWKIFSQRFPFFTKLTDAFVKDKAVKSKLEELSGIKHLIESQLKADAQLKVWQYLHFVSEYRAYQPSFSELASRSLLDYLQYLSKRRIGLSIHDEEAKLLLINFEESNWTTAFAQLSESALLDSSPTNKLNQVQIDLMWIGLNLLAPQGEHLIDWEDLVREQYHGQQTSLFAPQNSASEARQIQNTSYPLIALDLRKQPHPYRYAQRGADALDNKILEDVQKSGIEQTSIQERDRLVFWAIEKLKESAILLCVLPDEVLESDKDLYFRTYVYQHFQEVYILELPDDQKGLCVLYLVKKSASVKRNYEIRHCTIPLQKLLQKGIEDADDLKWKEIDFISQNYWISLPDTDFFEHLPLYGSEDAIFINSSEGTNPHLGSWLVAPSAKILEKKVRYLIKQYSKALNANGDLPDEIKWPESLHSMAKGGMRLKFDSQKIKAIQVAPFVYLYIYHEELLMNKFMSEVATIVYETQPLQSFATVSPWLAQNNRVGFPIYSADQEYNISDAALKVFSEYYEQLIHQPQTKAEAFPPLAITQTLESIASVSRDLPLIRKYPDQIHQLLQNAQHYSTDISLLNPAREKIAELSSKVQHLERGAVERKGIYQRVRAYAQELNEQLSAITFKFDEALKDAEAVSKENIFYYSFAQLQDSAYQKKYGVFLQREWPRIPLLPGFRKWVALGKAFFDVQNISTDSQNPLAQIQSKTEKFEKPLSRTLQYDYDEERSVIILKEKAQQLTLSNIPVESWQYQYLKAYIFVPYLDYLKQYKPKHKLVRDKFKTDALSDTQNLAIQLKKLCLMASKLTKVEVPQRDS